MSQQTKSKKDNVQEVAQPLSQGEKAFKGLHNPVKADKLVPGVTDQEHVFKGLARKMDQPTASYEIYKSEDESKENYDKGLKVKEDPYGEETEVKEASYSAKDAAAGKDIGKPGKWFGKIAQKAGAKVAGAVLKNLRGNAKMPKKKMLKDEVEQTDEALSKNWDSAHTKDKDISHSKPSMKDYRRPGIPSKEQLRQQAADAMRKHLAKKSTNEEVEQVDERHLSDTEMKKREDIAKSLPEKDFKKRYGKDWMAVKMATATKMAKNEETEHDINVPGGQGIKYKKHENAKKYVAGNVKDAADHAKAVTTMVKQHEEAIHEDYDDYDYEGAMAKTELRALSDKATHLADMMSDEMQLEAWLQSKISRAKDQIDAVYDYMMYKDHDKPAVETAAVVAPMPSQQTPMADTYGSFLNRMGEEVEQVTEDKEKDLAALAPPRDKVTKKDILVGRGVLKQHPKDPDKHILAKEESVMKAAKDKLKMKLGK